MFRISQYMQEIADPKPLGPKRNPPGPVVIWNLIRRCNLTCKHCYSISADKDFPGELTTEEIYGVMDDLKGFRVPVLILSGGEPLLRPDIFDIAKRAKAKGIPVYYYLPPQLWAWGGWRIGKMRRTVDCVLASLPMEIDYYRKAGMPVVSVGHPFFDHVAQQTLDQRWMADHRPVDRVHVALLPGSRSHEVRHNWPWQLAVLGLR